MVHSPVWQGLCFFGGLYISKCLFLICHTHTSHIILCDMSRCENLRLLNLRVQHVSSISSKKAPEMGSGPGCPGLSDGDDTAWGPRPRMFPVWTNVGAQFLGFKKQDRPEMGILWDLMGNIGDTYEINRRTIPCVAIKSWCLPCF